MLLLRGGQVIDGTGAERVRADVLCGDQGWIERVGANLPVESAQVVDCGGLVLAPGFIDTHAHSDLALLCAPDLAMKVRQGVTLDVVGQDGLSLVPVVSAEAGARLREELSWLLGRGEVEAGILSVGQYLGAIDHAGAALGAAYLCPHGALRTLAMGESSAREPTAYELARMCAELRRALEQGALGLSTGLIYPPCVWANADELVALCREVAAMGRVFAVHLRSESDHVLAAVDEMLDVTRRSGVHLHISHLKILGTRNAGLIEPLLARIEAAQAEGLVVTADQYPYTASSTTLAAILPSWAQSGGSEATLARLADPVQLARVRRAIAEPGADDGVSAWQRTGPEAILISDVASGRRPELVGKNLLEAARLAGQGDDVLGFALALLSSERLGVSMISFSQDEAVVERILGLPYVSVCTDGLLGGRPHPRSYGAFPRVLARYVRERGTLTLEEAVRKMTSQAARSMHLATHGVLEPGKAADVVVFAPDTVRDVADYADPMRYPEGIPHVVVAGKRVVADGQPTGVRPGGARRGGPAA